MSTTPKTNTHTDLFRATCLQLSAMGFTSEQAAGYLLAEETHGALKPNSPEWIKQSTLFRIHRGEAPSSQRLSDLQRITDALWELGEWRDAVHDIDGY